MAEDSKPRKDSRSLLRKTFDTVEGAVASRAEPMARSGGFARVLGVYVSVNKGVRGVAGKATGGLLHLVNIPTTGDVGKLHQHLASVDSHLAALMRDHERLASPEDIQTLQALEAEEAGGLPESSAKATTPKRRRSEPVPSAGTRPPASGKPTDTAGGKASPDRRGSGG